MSKVLLAEDDPTMLSLLKTLLAIEGFEPVAILEKHGDLIENIRREQPQAILLDVNLGNRDGIEIVRQIRAVPELQSVRVIMTSGLPRAEECLAAGADDFLLKPYMPDDLINRLRR
ncbi:MAG: response regulator [Anaerolineales bacterium]